MEFQKVAKEIIEKLKTWKGEGKLIVGLDGYSGIGKTTLCKQITEIYSEVEVLNMDDIVTTANTKENLLPQIESNSQILILEWKPEDEITKLKQAVQTFRDNAEGKQILLVEGIFLYHTELDSIWDKRVYLDGNFEQADARRAKREKDRWGDKYMSETHPDSYARLFKIAYARYLELYKPEEKVDLVLKID